MLSFDNYAQGMASSTANGSVTEQLWENSDKAFFHAVEKCQPDGMIVVGKRLKLHLPDLGASDVVAEVDVSSTPHVSRGFSSDPWGSRVEQFIADV